MLVMQNLIPSHCLLPWYDTFILCFFHLQPLTWFSLATITAYDLISRAFSIIIFFLYGINRSSFAFCLFPLWEFAFALLFWHIFSCIFMFSLCPVGELPLCLLKLSILYRMLHLFKSAKAALEQVPWIFSYKYLNLHSLILILHNTWNTFCLCKLALMICSQA